MKNKKGESKKFIIIGFLILGIFLLNFISASTIINYTNGTGGGHETLQSNSVNDIFIYDITKENLEFCCSLLKTSNFVFSGFNFEGYSIFAKLPKDSVDYTTWFNDSTKSWWEMKNE